MTAKHIQKRGRKNKKVLEKKYHFYEAGLRTIGFLASLAIAGIAIHEHVDSAVVWAFLGYAIGSSSAGIKNI